MSVQSVKVSQVFSKEVAKRWGSKGELIKQIQGNDDPLLRELNNVLKNKTSILEIGCGSGKIIEYIANKYNGCHIVGVDISKDMINIAKSRTNEVKYKNNEIEFIAGNIEDCAIKQNSFDVIMLKQVLHHLNNPTSILRKIKGFLKQDGVIILMVPGRKLSI